MKIAEKNNGNNNSNNNDCNYNNNQEQVSEEEYLTDHQYEYFKDDYNKQICLLHRSLVYQIIFDENVNTYIYLVLF
jgi:catabolite regulation protein CreA